MRPVTFPYAVHRGIKIPSIPLMLKISGEWRKFWAFVDTGATFSIFKAEEVEGFSWQKGELRHVQVGDGNFIPVYLHRLPLRLGNFEIKATVGFSARLGVEFNLPPKPSAMIQVYFSTSIPISGEPPTAGGRNWRRKEMSLDK